MSTKEKPLMTVAEVAEFFGVQPLTIREWCRNGRFPGAFKLGRSWKIKRESVYALAQLKYGDDE